MRRPLRARRPSGLFRTASPPELARELVAAGRMAYGRGGAKALPIPFDDLSTDFGTDVYEEMLLDAQVAACMSILKTGILEDGLLLAPAVEDQEDPKYKKAVKIRDAGKRMLDRLDQPFDDVMWTMLDGIGFGNKVAELVFENQLVDGETMTQIRAIKPKPRESVLFVVDVYLNLLGFLGSAPGQVTPGLAGNILEQGSRQVLPRDKFAVFTFRPVDCDPRGTSILRAAYEPWWRKRQMMPAYLRYLAQFASPSVWATPPEDTLIVAPTDSIGNLVDASGDAIDDPDGVADEDLPIAAADELLALLLGWQNGTALVVPPGTEVHPVELQGDGAPFLNAIQQANAEIVKAILTQSLATEEGAHQARAAASVHQDVLDTLIRQAKKALLRMIAEDILRPWVRLNYGDDAADELCPLPTLGTTERQDLPQMWTGAAALHRANYFHPSQLPHVDEMLGLPVRDLTQIPQPLAAPAPAPGEPSAPAGGQKRGDGTPDTPGTPSKPSGPAERGGRGRQPARQPAADVEDLLVGALQRLRDQRYTRTPGPGAIDDGATGR
jgi:hypothetical protein